MPFWNGAQGGEGFLQRMALIVYIKINLTFESFDMYYYRIADPRTA
jgi:hypothetical protein